MKRDVSALPVFMRWIDAHSVRNKFYERLMFTPLRTVPSFAPATSRMVPSRVSWGRTHLRGRLLSVWFDIVLNSNGFLTPLANLAPARNPIGIGYNAEKPNVQLREISV
jgi:hypothetical protein